MRTCAHRLKGAVAGVVVAAGWVWAQPPTPEWGPIPFTVYDLDGDGFITEQEFNTVRSERVEERSRSGRPMRGLPDAPAFSDLDRNGDGRLNPEELLLGRRQWMDQHRGRPDRWGPGGGSGPGIAPNPGNPGLAPGDGMAPGGPPTR